MSTLQIQTILYNNKKEDLIKSLDSIKNAIKVSSSSNQEFDVINVCYGDASPSHVFSEKEIQTIKQHFEESFKFNYTYFDYNTGTSKGHNLLAKNCNTDYLLLMNPDIIFAPDFLTEIIKPFSNDSNVGIVEGRQVPIEHPKEYSVKTGETSWSSGACTFTKTNLFHQVNGYDEETFFMYCDDVDLSWRIRLLGKKVIYQPRAMVFHAKRLSNEGEWNPTSAEAYYSAEAGLLMAYKWSNSELLLKLITHFKASKDENLIKAVNNFEMRKEKNSLPEQLDKNHKVAKFIDGNYSEHRFAL